MGFRVVPRRPVVRLRAAIRAAVHAAAPHAGGLAEAAVARRAGPTARPDCGQVIEPVHHPLRAHRRIRRNRDRLAVTAQTVEVRALASPALARGLAPARRTQEQLEGNCRLQRMAASSPVQAAAQQVRRLLDRSAGAAATAAPPERAGLTCVLLPAPRQWPSLYRSPRFWRAPRSVEAAELTAQTEPAQLLLEAAPYRAEKRLPHCPRPAPAPAAARDESRLVGVDVLRAEQDVAQDPQVRSRPRHSPQHRLPLARRRPGPYPPEAPAAQDSRGTPPRHRPRPQFDRLRPHLTTAATRSSQARCGPAHADGPRPVSRRPSHRVDDVGVVATLLTAQPRALAQRQPARDPDQSAPPVLLPVRCLPSAAARKLMPVRMPRRRLRRTSPTPLLPLPSPLAEP